MKKRLTALLLMITMISTLSGIAAAKAANTGFIWPTSSHTLVRGYSQNHGGLDIKVASGTPVYASAGGTVLYVYSGCNNVSGAGGSCRKAGMCSPNAGFNRSSGYCNEGFGNGVVLRHGDGSYTAYAHLLAGSVTVKPGDVVAQGQQIGKSGSSGFSTGPHLHFTLLRSSNLAYWVAFNKGYATDPLPYLNGDGEVKLVTAQTKGADSITETSAILRGEVHSVGDKITECGMYIGTSREKLTILGSDKGLSTYGTPCYYSTSKYGYELTPGTTYYYQVYAVAGNTIEKGETESFTTPGGGTLLLTDAEVSGITETSAQVEATCSYIGTPPSHVGIYFGATPEELSVHDWDAIKHDRTAFSVQFDLRDLDSGTTYYYQFFAMTDRGVQKGEIGSFQTEGTEELIPTPILDSDPTPPPTPTVNPDIKVYTKGADTITETSAIVRGDFSVVDGRASECGMYLGTSQDDLTKLGSDAINSAGVAFYYSTAKFGRTLTPGTTYYYRAYVVVNGETYWGETASFTTASSVTVTTKGADGITATAATVRGQVVSPKQKASECGMYLGTSPDNMTKLGSDAINANNMPFYYGTAKYGRPLTAGTTYYYQAYAIVNGVTYWGEVKSFTTATR